MKVVVASDFHLKFQKDQEAINREIRVISFLKSLTGNTDVLILNGDIFDLWFSWKHVVIKEYFKIYVAMEDLRKSGCRMIFISGNHDFWFNDFLKEYLGFEIYKNFFSEIIDNKKLFVTHGDLYTKNDWRYKIFRTLIRKKIVKYLFKLIHPDFGLNLGTLLSRSSRNRKTTSNIKQKKESGLMEFAVKKLENYDIVIMGHSHNPMLLTKKNKIYANSGDWLNHNSFITITDGKIKLHK